MIYKIVNDFPEKLCYTKYSSPGSAFSEGKHREDE